MPLITASNLSVSFAELDVFEGISLEVGETRPRGASSGPNGQGKDDPAGDAGGAASLRSSGSVRRRRGLNIGYVPQDGRGTWTPRTLGEEVMKAFAEVMRIEGEIALSAAAIQRADEDGRRKRRATGTRDMLEAYEAAGGYDYENRLERVIAGVGAADGKRWTCPSTRQAAASAPARPLRRHCWPSHTCSSLDEPTNYLDFDGTQLAGGLFCAETSPRLRRRLA